MIIMPANSNKALAMYLLAKTEGTGTSLGHLYSPGGQRGPYPFVQYALDNGAFPLHAKGKPFDFDEWRRLLDWALDSGQKPLFALAPDKIQDAYGTLHWYYRYGHEITDRGFNIGICICDGMEKVEERELQKLNAHTWFLGGSNAFRDNYAEHFAALPYKKHFHVGRINTLRGLNMAHQLGADSCDGTGWFRGDRKTVQDLIRFLSCHSGVPLDPEALTRDYRGKGAGRKKEIPAVEASQLDLFSGAFSSARKTDKDRAFEQLSLF